MADNYGRAALDLVGKNNQVIKSTASKVYAVGKAKDLLVDSPSIDVMDYSIYQAIFQNPLDTPLVNEQAAIYIKFKVGECASADCLEVLVAGEAVPFQFEADVHPNPRIATNLGAHGDGSLKSGYIWIMVDIEESLEVVIRVHAQAQEHNFTPAVVHRVIGSTPGSGQEALEAGGVSVRLNENAAWGIRYLYIDGVEMVGGIVSQRTTIRNNLYEDIHSNTAAAVQGLTRTVNGSGAVFRDYDVSYRFAYNENIKVTTKIRMFSNGKYELTSRVYVLSDLEAGVLNGVYFRTAFQNVGAIKGGGFDGEGYRGLTVSGKSLLYQVKYFQYLPDGNPKENGYSAQTSASEDDGFVYLTNFWYNTSPKTLALKKDSYYTSVLLFNPRADLSSAPNISKYVTMGMNTPRTAATKTFRDGLVQQVATLAKEFVRLNADKAISSSNFPMLRALVQLTRNEIYGEDDVTEPYTTLKNAVQYLYGGGTASGIYSAYPARGIEYIGRDMSALKHFRNKFIALGREEDVVYIERVMHALADAFILIEEYSGGEGKITLSSTVGDNMNAEAAAMKFLKQSLDLEEDNADRLACYMRIKNRFEGGLLYRNILPYAIGQNVFMQQLSHYHGFSVYDYLEAVDSPSFHAYNYIMDYSTPSGFMKEVGYNYTGTKFGLTHTAMYSAAVLHHVGTISTLQQSASILEHLVSRCYPTGYHDPIIDGWKNTDPSSPLIECQVACEIYMGELYGGSI